MDRRQAMAGGNLLPERTRGAALFADISGFTPLTEALMLELGAQRAAEELTIHLNRVFDAVIKELHRFGSCVISFGGDAITCWFDQDDGLRATTCALSLQEVMTQFKQVRVPTQKTGTLGSYISLTIKTAVVTGPALRFVVGDPEIQLIDVLAGTTLDHLIAAEHHALKGEVVIDGQTAQSLGKQLIPAEWREDLETGEKFCVVKGLVSPAPEQPFKPVPTTSLAEESLKSWLLPPVYERLRQGQGEFLAELRPVLVLFLNFAGIDYDHDDEAKEKLDAFIRWVQKVLAHYESYLLQLILGDKGSYLYAAFGAPIAHEDDAVRAVSAAIDLHIPPPELAYIQNVKIGITQGRLRTGSYGGSLRRTYGVMGDDVNLASRLMLAASPGQILVNQVVKQGTGSTFTWEDLQPIRAKGKTEPIAVSSPLGMRARQTLRLQVPVYALPMVGREQEMSLCDSKLEQALAGHGQLLGITGEAGLGKTRLVAEIIRRATHHHMICFGGECESYATDTSYLVWQSIWRGLFDVNPLDPLSEQVDDLQNRLNLIAPDLAQRLPLVGKVLNLPIPDNDLTSALDAKLRKTSLETLLVDYLRFQAHQQPVMLVLEDCQWMDPLSHDLLEVVGRVIYDIPVLIVVVLRPPELLRLQKPRVSNLANYTEILVREFTPEQAKKLIVLKLSQYGIEEDQIPKELVTRITTQAEGNPFYVEELLNYLHDQGVDPQDSQALTQLDLPTSVHSLILSRLDQLSDKQQITLKVASIIGRIFRATLLWGTYPELGEPERVQADLEMLCQMQLTIQDTKEQELTYFFKQIVTQQVAYENLPFATRIALHGQLALYIERNYSQTVDQYVNILAYHFFKGEIWEKALQYNLGAARRAQQEFANEAATAFCQFALAAAEHLEAATETRGDILTVHEILGEVYMLIGQYDKALLHYGIAHSFLVDHAEVLNQKEYLAKICRKTAEVYERRSEYEVAFEWLEKGLGHLTPNEPKLEAIDIFYLGSALYYRQMKYDEAISWSQRCLNLASMVKNHEVQKTIARTYYLLGSIYWRRGDISQSIDLCNKSIGIFQEIDDIVGQARAYNNLGIAYSEIGDMAQASQAYHKSLEINQRIGDVYEQGNVANNLALLHLDLGDWKEATKLFEESNSIWKQVGAVLPEAVTLSNLAQVHIYLGNWEQARSFLEHSQELFATVGTEDFLAELERRWGELYLRTGELDQASTHIQRSLELAVTQESRLDEGMSVRVSGEILLAQGNLQAAEETLQKSLAILTELDSEFEAGKTLLLLAQLKLQGGTTEFPLEKIEQAITTFYNLGSKPYLEQAIALKNRLGQLSDKHE